ncbi:hypothetical protein GQ54DRAFT_319659, partial [Martensiomyces pterosporus]
PAFPPALFAYLNLPLTFIHRSSHCNCICPTFPHIPSVYVQLKISSIMTIARMLSAALSGLAMLQSVGGSTSSPSDAPLFNSTNIQGFRGGLLVKNGTQTSCEVALMGPSSAFVAANCLDYSGKLPSTETAYQVFLDDGNKVDPIAYRIDPTDIVVHPSYDSVTLANNIAIIQFNKDGRNPFENYIAGNPGDWTDMVYVRRTLSDVAKMKWRVPTVYTQFSSDLACDRASPLYTENKSCYRCISASTVSIYDSKCKVPYGAIYAAHKQQLSIAAIYSHTVVDGDGLCGNSTQFNYYTILDKYAGFAVHVLNTSVVMFSSGKSTPYNNNIVYTMNPPSATTNTTSKFKSVGGDIYALEGVVQATAPASSSTPAPTTSTAPLATATVTGSPAAPPPVDLSSTERNGLTRQQTMIIAIVVPIVSIIIIVALFFLYKWWRKRVRTVMWDPKTEVLHMQSLAYDLGEIPSVSPFSTAPQERSWPPRRVSFLPPPLPPKP